MKYLSWLLILALVLGIGWYIWNSFTRPVVGDAVPDLGREHITDIAGIEYNSNPPTSGKHFPAWAKKGIYDRVLSDGYLIHSLEHGYIIVSYNCEQSVLSSQYSVVRKAYAHEGEEDIATDSAGTSAVSSVPNGSPQADSGTATNSARPVVPLHRMSLSTPFTPDNPPAAEVELPESFKSEECQQLVDQLRELTKVKERVIIVPRPTTDAKVALTAWGRILKMDPSTSSGLSSQDMENAKQFIRDFENRGPEKTME